MNPLVYGRTGKPKHRHAYPTLIEPDGITRGPCACGQPFDPGAARRGRNNRARGNAIEREVCRALGISRVGQYGGPEDGGKQSEWIAVQVKSGGIYPERIDALLRRMAYRSDQLRAVVHADTPGSAGKRRMLITLDLGEFADWYGKG
jgi:hypothetical protein